MLHLAEVHIPDGTEDFANDVHMRAVLVQNSLENTSSAMFMVKDLATNAVSATNTDDDNNGQDVLRQIDDVIAATRSAKVIVSKAARSLEELKTRFLSLLPETLLAFERCENMSIELRDFSQALGERVLDWSRQEEDDGSGSSRSYIEIEELLHRTTLEHFHTNDIIALSTFREKLRSLHASLSDLNALANDLSQTIEFESPPHPWMLCAQNMRASARDPEAVEAQLQSLRDAAHSSGTQLSMRDKLLEESHVKIELLEARAKDASKKSEQIAELEQSVHELQRRQKTLEAMLDARSRELTELESERERWKTTKLNSTTTTNKGHRRTTSSKTGVEDGEEGEEQDDDGGLQDASTLRNVRASARAIQIYHKEIHDLQNAVRYLREENQRIRDADLRRRVSWLHEPLVPDPDPVEARVGLIRSEAKDVLHEMLDLVSKTTTGTGMEAGMGQTGMGQASIYDLRNTPPNRLAWRPAQSTPLWHVMKQREEWERWKEWERDVLQKERQVGIVREKESSAASNDADGSSKRKKKGRRSKGTAGVTMPARETKFEMEMVMMEQMDKLKMASEGASQQSGVVIVDENEHSHGRGRTAEAV